MWHMGSWHMGSGLTFTDAPMGSGLTFTDVRRKLHEMWGRGEEPSE